MPISFRTVEDSDIPAMARIRADEWGGMEFWIDRIARYKHGEHSPQKSLPERIIFVAVNDEGDVVGFVAGHRTQRHNCDGELQWVNVAGPNRGCGIAEKLIAKMGLWFVEQNAQRICVNVDSQNATARRLYARCGARDLSDQWMIWDNAQAMGSK
jgi:predicted GNAT family acetyltransferase